MGPAAPPIILNKRQIETAPGAPCLLFSIIIRVRVRRESGDSVQSFREFQRDPHWDPEGSAFVATAEM